MAFGALVSRHHQRVFAFLLALTRHRQDAEDLTQETFLRAWNKFHRYNPDLPLLPWLFTIARRLSISALRRARPVPADSFAPTDQEPADRALWLWGFAKANLTSDAYSTLWLHYREELSLKEIAAVMGKREGAIKVILHRARKSLAEKIRGNRHFRHSRLISPTPTHDAMKREDPFQDIDDLLRSKQPDPLHSPGLESRILRALDQQQRPTPYRWWPWLALPPVLAAAAIMLDHRPPALENSTPLAETTIPADPSVEPALSRMLAENPLKNETRSLGRDVERAGGFLIDCLPSIGNE